MTLEEWTVVDTETSQFILVKATGQIDAWEKGLKYDIVAKRTDHVRPRTGDAVLMGKEEFKDFLKRRKKD